MGSDTGSCIQIAADNDVAVEDLKAHNLTGTPAREFSDGENGRLVDLGVQRVYLQLGEFSQAEHVERFAADVMPRQAQLSDRGHSSGSGSH